MKPEHSTGWSRLSDCELAEWHAEKVDNDDIQAFEQVLGTGTEELQKRGIIILDCSQCDRRRMVQAHDYICILCRRAS